MTSFNVDDVVNALESTHVSPNGVSFEGKSLKLDTEEDVKVVVEAINKCNSLEYLNLEGNTLGVEASKLIANALEKHPELKQALWKDMFTGRMKTEIPKALEHLGAGLVTAGAHLRELDLSDNAFGPIGVEGLAALLRSPSCYALEELRLNNNGLGITGGKLLASALLDCYNSSKKQGKPLALKVFIAGRNRLENDGAKALAEVFRTIGTLEEIAMPQNGIYHVGIAALSEAFTHNKNLEILNLNDNTIGPKGSEAISKVLPGLQNLKEINFGDCLLKTKGALLLAGGLKDGHKNLEVLVLGYNEIRSKGGVEVVKAMANKTKLKKLILSGNQFGSDGKNEVENKLKEIGRLNTLGSLSDNESEDSEEDMEEEESDSHSEDESTVQITELPDTEVEGPSVTIQDFLKNPSVENFIGLGQNRADILLQEASKNMNLYLETFVPILMKVAALSISSDKNVAESASKCAELLYRELFTWAQKSENISHLNNTLLVHLGLIKSEDKQFKPTWNIEGCLTSLQFIVNKNYVPESTRDTLKAFMQREISNNGQCLQLKKKILDTLK